MAQDSTQQTICRIGTSGYHYDHWKYVFYPEDLRKKTWFDYYAEHFNTVEINNTFYGLPDEDIFQKWRDRAPKEFLYALKFSRYGSHLKKLKDPGDSISEFVKRIKPLGQTTGPILVQLPPRWHPNPRRLAAFLEETSEDLRWAVEFRNSEWLCEEIYAVLRSNNVALCIHDMLNDHPRLLTTDWTYIRFHGNHYEGSYAHQVLSAWARWIKERLHNGRSVYAYFNNDAEGHAVQNARSLKRYVLGGGKDTM
ncbi:MAG: DUF72 domain-containing protein [Deltaproteobacteria bacterium]|nr:DUF72 domain-containing protein [Deltaproteobacteria bacterium]